VISVYFAFVDIGQFEMNLLVKFNLPAAAVFLLKSHIARRVQGVQSEFS